jgi:hypothetical protein
MKLYEISGEFRELFDQLDDLCDTDGQENNAAAELFREGIMQAWFDSLEMIEQDFTEKAENVAAYIKELKADADALKAEEAKLKERREQKERKIGYFKQYLLDSMQTVHLTKIDGTKAKISVRNNAESVKVSDEHAFIAWAQEHNDDLLRYKMPEIDKTSVKKLLKSGAELPCVTLVRTQSVIIK